MKYLFIGAGAIGSYLGGALLKTGKDVCFLEKPEYYQRLQQNIFRLILQTGEVFKTNLQVFDSPEKAFKNKPDVIIFAMKSFDTDEAARSLTDFVNEDQVILSFQNGVENEDTIRKYCKKPKVLSATLTSAIGKTQQGEIVVEKFRGVGIEDSCEQSRLIWQDFKDAGVNPVLYKSAADMKWSKMISNLLLNSTCAILDMTPAEVMNNEAVFQIEMDQIREALQVMDAFGIKPINLPKVPIALLSFAIRFFPTGILQRILKKPLSSGRGNKMPSFHIDLHAGRKMSEVDYLNGAVFRFGQRAGIHTPVNKVLNTTLLDLTINISNIPDYQKNPELLVNAIQLEKTGI
jgi:2-dehydropantoate 2-reductase